jgi:hypothetical protein
MIVKIIEGDLLNATQKYIAQQCNCNTIKSHGLSKSIADKYPWADPYSCRKKKYNNSTSEPDEPGTIVELTDPLSDFSVLCFMSQWLPGRPRIHKERYSTTHILEKNNKIFTGPILPIKSKHTIKDQKKSNMANKFIGQGSINSSTYKYFCEWNKCGKANVGKYTSEDIVFISAEGKRKNRLSVDEVEIEKALEARAIIIADNFIDRMNPYNLGERELLTLLEKANYIEYPKDSGYWFPPNYDDTYENRKLWFQECIDILDSMEYGLIGIPYGIGSGLAGGKWSDYKSMLEKAKTKFVVYKLPHK